MAIDSRIPLAGQPPPPIDLPGIEQQALITSEMQARAQDRVQKAKDEAAQRKGNEALNQFLKDSIIETEDGLLTYDRNKLLPVLSQMGPQSKQVMELLDFSDKAIVTARKAQQEAVVAEARMIAATGNNPVAFVRSLDRLVKNGIVSERYIAELRDVVVQNPDAIAGITHTLINGKPPTAGEGDFTLGGGDNAARFRAGESTPYATAPIPRPDPDKPVFATDIGKTGVKQIGTIPANAELVQRVQPSAAAQGGGGAATSNLQPQVQSVLGRLLTNMPSTRVGQIRSEVSRLAKIAADTGKPEAENELKDYLRFAAIEREDVANKTAMKGRIGTIKALEDARELLRQVPTGIVAGTWEELMRKLGETGDTRMVKLKTSLGNVLAQYIRSISGAAVTEQEAQRLGALFPNYSNSMPVNMAVIEGLSDSMKSLDSAFYNHVFGPNAEWVFTKTAPSGAGGSNKLSAEELIKKYGGGR